MLDQFSSLCDEFVQKLHVVSGEKVRKDVNNDLRVDYTYLRLPSVLF